LSPAKIIRTVAAALIAGGAALGLVPSGSCGAGWWIPISGDATYGWFAYQPLEEAAPTMMASTCDMVMAPVGSWAIALVVIGATLVAGMWFHTRHRPKGEPTT
jgi:heme/copper-type cytochrome/quinol oxidase subunit 1